MDLLLVPAVVDDDEAAATDKLSCRSVEIDIVTVVGSSAGRVEAIERALCILLMQQNNPLQQKTAAIFGHCHLKVDGRFC